MLLCSFFTSDYWYRGIVYWPFCYVHFLQVIIVTAVMFIDVIICYRGWKGNSTTHEVWLAPGFQSQRGVCVSLYFEHFIFLTQVQFSHRVTKFRLPLLGQPWWSNRKLLAIVYQFFTRYNVLKLNQRTLCVSVCVCGKVCVCNVLLLGYKTLCVYVCVLLLIVILLQ